MRVIAILCMLVLLTVVTAPAKMQDAAGEPAPIVISNTETITLTSTSTNQEYLISVALPASYATSGRSYPVVYVLDPAATFLSVTEFTRWMAVWQEMPELIVVGIGYPTEEIEAIMPLRERDYHRSPANFLDFISKELFPVVDSTYRTEKTDRALIGYSYGGEFVLHTLVAEPELFARYIAIDFNAEAANELLQLLILDNEEFRAHFVGRDVRVFIASDGQTGLSSAIEARAYDGLTAHGLSLGNDVTHAAALHLSLPAGILAIYDN